MPRARDIGKNLLLLAFVAVLAEVGLTLGARFSAPVRQALAPPWETYPPLVPDEALLSRGNPLYPGHDSAGYRNPSRPARADIVVLGDSQAYGPENPGDAWPRLMTTGAMSVYNMALPSYGPAHFRLQLEEALALKPRAIVVAPYFGNDFFDAFVVARRHPEIAAGIDESLLEQARRRDAERAIETEVALVAGLGAEDRAPKAPRSALRQWLSSTSLYALARGLRYHVFERPQGSPLLANDFGAAVAALSPAQREYAAPFDEGEWRTILTAPYRAKVLDDRDPRIRMGFEVSRRALGEIARRCRAAGVRLLVVLIPTKELVFATRVGDRTRYPGLERLVSDEARLREEWLRDLEASGIEHVDLLPVLRGAAEQPYPPNIDGHPNRSGNRVIAAAVGARLTADPPPARQ
jgi:hypothetical protein